MEGQSVENQTIQPQHKKMLYLLIVLLLLGFAVLLLILRSFKVATTDRASVTPSAGSVTSPKNGKLVLQSKSGKTSFKVGELIVLTVLASSDNKNIAGYDVLLNYKEGVDFYNHLSLIDSFQAIPKNLQNTLSITGFKTPGSQRTFVFNNSPIVDVSFLSKKTGTYQFTLEYVSNSTRESNLMTEESKTQDILGSVENLTVTVSN